MARLTITLSDEHHRALKEAAARRGSTIGKIIQASLDAYGVKTVAAARSLVARARERASLGEDDATVLAVEETCATRSAR